MLSIMVIISVLKRLKKVNLWKTLYFNFHYFPFKTAIHIPVFIYRRSDLYQMGGKIVIDAPVSTGMIRFGSHGLGTQDLLYSRTMWDVSGTLVIKGDAIIGRGSKISIGKGATLTLGGHFIITGNSEIICQKGITFGERCLLSWDILIMDTDFHHVLQRSEVGPFLLYEVFREPNQGRLRLRWNPCEHHLQGQKISFLSLSIGKK